MNRSDQHSGIIWLLYCYSGLELLRNKFGLILLFVIPGVFLVVANLTAGEIRIPIKLYFYAEIKSVMLTQKDISLLFMSAAVCGFLAAFYASILFHQNFQFFRYCGSMGLSPYKFLIARFSFFMTVVLVLAMFMALVINIILPFGRFEIMLIGFILLGATYGAYGGIVGVLCKDYLVALLLIILLANFDAGWLQNPVFYSYAQETEFIHWLPAFYPCQLIFSAIYDKDINLWAGFLSFCYSFFLLVILYLLVHFKMKVVTVNRDLALENDST